MDSGEREARRRVEARPGLNRPSRFETREVAACRRLPATKRFWWRLSNLPAFFDAYDHDERKTTGTHDVCFQVHCSRVLTWILYGGLPHVKVESHSCDAWVNVVAQRSSSRHCPSTASPSEGRSSGMFKKQHLRHSSR